MHPAKTQISLDIRPVWSESSLSAWRKLGSLPTHWAHSKDWSVFAGCKVILLVLSWGGSFYKFIMLQQQQPQQQMSPVSRGNRSGGPGTPPMPPPPVPPGMNQEQNRQQQVNFEQSAVISLGPKVFGLFFWPWWSITKNKALTKEKIL